MARARNLKPGFFKNEELGELDPIERLFFAGLWCLADCKGRLEYRPKRLKIEILPYDDDADIERIVINLDKSGFIRKYSVQGEHYIEVINFAKHQNPHKNERDKGSEIPDPPKVSAQPIDITKDRDKSRKIEINPEQDGTDRADSLLLIPDSLNPNPDSGLLSEESRQQHTATDWKPSGDVLKVLSNSGFKTEWITEAFIAEFKIFWKEKNPDLTHSQLDSKFLGHCSRQKPLQQIADHKLQVVKQNSLESEQPFITKHTDQSWREGLN